MSAFQLDRNNMVKITMIGAGSIIFTRHLIVDVLSFPALTDCTICLMDIDRRRLDMITTFAKKLVAQERFQTRIESTSDQAVALRDADFVVTMIQVGGLEAFEYDISIPLKYGIRQSVGDTLGPGGIFRFLRTVPAFKSIAEDMEKICPKALWINYVNPMAMNCMYVNRISDLSMVGLCHSVQWTTKSMAGIISAPYDEVSYLSAGINHMAWILKFEWKSKDAYPLLIKKLGDEDTYMKDVTKFEFLDKFGYYVTESSLHMSEYVPYFRHFDHWIELIHMKGTWHENSPVGTYLERCQASADTFESDMEKLVQEDKVDMTRSHEFGSYLINAMTSGQSTVVYGNVPNKSLITNLPEGCCVELPCLVDKNGVQPTVVGDLPLQLAALNRTNINVQELAVAGAVTGKKDYIYQAAMLDPLTAAVLDMDSIKQMVDEMFDKQKQWLPLL